MTGQEPDVGATPLIDKATTADDTADAFRLLFESTYTRLVAYARRRTVNWSEADDVVSEVYTVAWRRRGELRPDTSPLPWLYGISGNVLRNHRRSTGRRLKLVGELEAQPPPETQGDPADLVAHELRTALEHLSFDDQEVLRLLAWEGLSHAQIGEALGCSTNAVGIRVHRARQRLSDQLNALQPEPDTDDLEEGTT